ncbi:unnamed protein product, partial [Rotaria socialis]
QVELLSGILHACHELIPIYLHKVPMSLKPRYRHRCLKNVAFFCVVLNCTVHVGVPSQSPLLVTLLFHVCSPKHLLRANFARGLAMASSPVIMFFTASLLVIIVERVNTTLTDLENSITWWSMRDPETCSRWTIVRQDFSAQVLKQISEFHMVID